MKNISVLIVFALLAAPCAAKFQCTEVMNDPDNALMPTMITCVKTVPVGKVDPKPLSFNVYNSVGPGSVLAKPGDVKVDMRVHMDGSFLEPREVRRAIKTAYDRKRFPRKDRPYKRVVEVGE